MSDSLTTGGVADLVRNGGRLCLDYINTVEPRTGPVARDWLTGYPDLIEWAQLGDIIDETEAAALRRTAADRPADAQAAFQVAIALREALFRLFAAIADGTAPPDADLTALRDAVAAATRHGRLAARAGGFDWSWDDTVPAAPPGVVPGDRLDRPWWPVAVSALNLLTQGPLDRIKMCGGDDGCSWLFVDTTKNRSRRWCSMEDCGSQSKSRRQTDRRRAARRRTSA